MKTAKRGTTTTRRRTSCGSEKATEGSGHREHAAVAIDTDRPTRTLNNERSENPDEKTSWKEEGKKYENRIFACVLLTAHVTRQPYSHTG